MVCPSICFESVQTRCLVNEIRPDISFGKTAVVNKKICFSTPTENCSQSTNLNTKLTFILKKNLYPSRLIERMIKRSVIQHVTGNSVRSTSEQAPNIFYFKLPYIGYFSSIAQMRIRRLSHFYCKDANIVLAFSSFKVGSLFSVKDPVPNGLRSCVVFKFSCAGCAACYVGETTRHFNTRVREHLETDRASHIFKHLESSSACRSACSRDNFAIIDQASSRFALKIKEALHIFWDKPTLNAQVKHVNLKLSV